MGDVLYFEADVDYCATCGMPMMGEAYCRINGDLVFCSKECAGEHWREECRLI